MVGVIPMSKHQANKLKRLRLLVAGTLVYDLVVTDCDYLGDLSVLSAMLIAKRGD